MTTILLAIGSSWLRRGCNGVLENLGYAVLPLDRPLAPLSISTVIGWHAALVDASPLGQGALQAIGLVESRPIIGLGVAATGVSRTLDLPLQEPVLVAALESVLFGATSTGDVLRLEPARSSASLNGRQVHLTHTEFRLLQLLYDARPADVPLAQVLTAVWGSTEGEATSELVRSHLRNLRRKLEQIGLPDVIRSRRGLGYSLHL